MNLIFAKIGVSGVIFKYFSYCFPLYFLGLSDFSYIYTVFTVVSVMAHTVACTGSRQNSEGPAQPLGQALCSEEEGKEEEGDRGYKVEGRRKKKEGVRKKNKVRNNINHDFKPKTNK